MQLLCTPIKSSLSSVNGPKQRSVSTTPSHFHPYFVVWRTNFGPVSIIPIFLGTGTVIGVIVFLTTHKDRIPKFHNVSTFSAFFCDLQQPFLLGSVLLFFHYSRLLVTAGDKLIAGFCISRLLGCHADGLFDSRRSGGRSSMCRIRFQYIGCHVRYYTTCMG